MQSNKIIIAGFSGAGKSSFLQALKTTAPQGWQDFIDLDFKVVTFIGTSSLAEFVEKQGWERFRDLEAQTLRIEIENKDSAIIALGGGSLTEPTLSLIQSRPEVVLVHLKADFQTCWERIQNSPSERPLVQKGEKFMKELFEERSEIFKKIPQVIENDGNRPLKELALEFWSRLQG